MFVRHRVLHCFLTASYAMGQQIFHTVRKCNNLLAGVWLPYLRFGCPQKSLLRMLRWT